MQMPALFAWPATRHLKPRPFNIILAIGCTVVHFCNGNFDIQHFFHPIWTSLLTCDWAKLNAVISLAWARNMCKKFSCPLKKKLSTEKIETNQVFTFQFLNDEIDQNTNFAKFPSTKWLFLE